MAATSADGLESAREAARAADQRDGGAGLPAITARRGDAEGHADETRQQPSAEQTNDESDRHGYLRPKAYPFYRRGQSPPLALRKKNFREGQTPLRLNTWPTVRTRILTSVQSVQLATYR